MSHAKFLAISNTVLKINKLKGRLFTVDKL